MRIPEVLDWPQRMSGSCHVCGRCSEGILVLTKDRAVFEFPDMASWHGEMVCHNPDGRFDVRCRMVTDPNVKAFRRTVHRHYPDG